MKLSLLTPERRLVTQIDVDSVTLPGSEGQIQILSGHAPMIGTLETGPFSYQVTGESKEQSGVISTGFFEIIENVVTVMAETTELKSEIDASRAKKAEKRAQDALVGAELDEQTFKKYQLKLQRALIRQQVASQGH